MTLSSSTLDHLNDAESHLRAALKSASVNESAAVIQMISRILAQVDEIKKYDNLMDLLEKKGSGGSSFNLF